MASDELVDLIMNKIRHELIQKIYYEGQINNLTNEDMSILLCSICVISIARVAARFENKESRNHFISAIMENIFIEIEDFEKRKKG